MVDVRITITRVLCMVTAMEVGVVNVRGSHFFGYFARIQFVLVVNYSMSFEVFLIRVFRLQQ